MEAMETPRRGFDRIQMRVVGQGRLELPPGGLAIRFSILLRYWP